MISATVSCKLSIEILINQTCVSFKVNFWRLDIEKLVPGFDGFIFQSLQKLTSVKVSREWRLTLTSDAYLPGSD